MMGGGGGAPPPGAGGPPPGAPPQPGMPPPGGMGGANAQPNSTPAAAGMSKPQDKKGLKAAAQTNVHIAVNMLEEALPAFGSESEEGKIILKALDKLSGLMGKRDSSDLVPAELMKMFKQMPQMGGGTDVQKQIAQQMAQKGPPPQQAA